MDYEVLLVKYIKWVIENEGVDFITNGAVRHELTHFTLDEWQKLEEIVKEYL